MTDISFKNIDEYLALQPENFRIILEKIRQLVKKICPDAQEVISYQIPTFKYYGMLVSFAAFKKHCSFFPGGIVPQFADELTDFKTSKGTIQFTPENPIPDKLLIKIIKFRMEQNLNKIKKKN